MWASFCILLLYQCKYFLFPFFHFLAHLTQRVMCGIAITWRPSFVRWLFHILIYSSETTGPNGTRFGRKNLWSSIKKLTNADIISVTCLFYTLQVGIHILIFYLENLAKGNKLLPSLGVRRLSSVYFSHFNLLLWKPSAKWTETW